MRYFKKGYRFSGITLSCVLFLFKTTTAQVTVNTWITAGDKTKLLQKQANISFSPDSGTNPTTIVVDENTTFQTMDGFGFTFTEGSAEVINTLNSTQQNALLNELFNPSTGSGISVVRISIGASDLSSSVYSYDQTSGDVTLNNFSLAGPDLNNLIPLLKKILIINPTIKFLATPWTAPTWMKTNQTWVGGSLDPTYYATYAAYFLKYLDAMKAQGISIWAITPQNEPGNANNTPSMLMTAAQETTFINTNLGPAIKNAGYSTKIIAYDHNCDDTNYPTSVLNNSTYVDGAAFHLYAGNISAMTTVHDATNKNVYFTEQYTGGGGAFGGDLAWHLQNVVIGSSRNWSKTILEWNLANDSGFGPHTSGGCTDCLGAITINNSTTYTRNVAFYIISHVSMFVNPGALRISSNSYSGGIENVAFKNTDGTKVLVAINSGNSNNAFKVKWGSLSYTYTLTPGAVASFKWGNSATYIPEQKITRPDFDIYPNPLTQQSATIDLSLLENHLPFEVFVQDVRGRTILVRKFEKNSTTALNMETIKSGMYFLTVKTSEESITKKFIIQ